MRESGLGGVIGSFGLKGLSWRARDGGGNGIIFRSHLHWDTMSLANAWTGGNMSTQRFFAWMAWAIGLAGMGGPAALAVDPPSARAYHPRQTPIVEACKKVRGAVVNIHSERKGGPSDAMGQPTQINGMGTGVIVDPRGYIVTNHHVIEDVTTLRVRLADGTTAPAKVIARDPETDLALLKIEVAKALPTMALGTTKDLMVGETVIAMGNAYGYEHTVTVGVVSALNRDVVLNRDLTYRALIQTDASINPGNSGGPLVNALGEMVGVNVAIRAGAQGIGFAIPVETMIRVCSDMIGNKRRGYGLGISFREEVDRPKEDGPVRRRVVVDRLEPGSTASKAGLKLGDELVRVGECDVESCIDWEKGFLDRLGGEKVGLVVRRDGGETRLDAQLETLGKPGLSEQIWAKIGIKVQPVGPELVHKVNQQLHGGLMIREMRPDSPAARAGWQKGDILVGLHEWEMISHENLLFALNHQEKSSAESMKFFVVRNSQVVKGSVPFGAVITTSDLGQ